MHFMPSSEHRELECLEELRMKKCQVVMRNEDESDNYSRTNSTSTVTRVRYGECQKNHAANIGGYAVDGCREFLGSGEEGTAAALTCACCGCHRSFHRREVQTELVCNDHDSSSST